MREDMPYRGPPPKRSSLFISDEEEDVEEVASSMKSDDAEEFPEEEDMDPRSSFLTMVPWLPWGIKEASILNKMSSQFF
ncbi:hypothetical protein COCNU_08G009330 [Cocos nucifera]|uniref:Uncharacterized protein n=1 Tax=Cocos nucifera TaxID=13894 RepID=A0A8K0N718_COCNU|nr:hypothetical protein COCNU_08G009330 [Cocos nucifera]